MVKTLERLASFTPNSLHPPTDELFLDLKREWKALLEVLMAGDDTEKETVDAFEKVDWAKEILHEEWTLLWKIRKKLK